MLPGDNLLIGSFPVNVAILTCLSLIVALEQPAPMQAKAPAPPAAGAQTGPYKVINTFQVGGEGGWDYLCVDPASHRLFVPRSSHVMVIDSETGKTVGDIPDTQGVHGVALASALGKGFTSNGKGNDITVFDLATLKPVKTIKAGDNPDAILYDPATKQVFAFNGRSKNATVINAEDLSVVGTIPLEGKPEYGATDEAGKVYVNIEDTNELVRIDAKSMKVEARIPLTPGEGPSGLAIDPAHHMLFSVCGEKDLMVIVDGPAGKMMSSAPIGKRVDGAGFDPAGFALSSNGEGTMTVVATSGPYPFTVVQTLQTAAGARTMAVDPTNRHIYLPTADFEPQAAGQKGRPKMKPNTFKIVVVGPA